MKLRTSDIEHTMPATLSQLAVLGIVLKSVPALSFLVSHFSDFGYRVPSEYTQSVMGHGRQQSTGPWAEGTGAQKRPLTSGCISARV